MEPATARAAGGRAGRVGDRPLDRARVAAYQEGAVNTCAWIVFLDESGVSLLPQICLSYSPRGQTPLLRHRLNWKRASMAGALGYHSTDPDRGARLCFHLKPGGYDTAGLIEVLEQMKVFYRGERVVLVWDGVSAHWSRPMRAWVAGQDWLTLERLTAYAPELNPVELLWSSLKKRELANLASDQIAQGKHHTQALLCLARRRADVLFAMLRDGTFYESRPTAVA
ncbi:transposase [Streptomyces sp. 135]|uniref:transposase n=1 Tax=Streptomyces sp. 135 TaxID=2838850 RepID=UPI001CC0D241|nr:transposase [Streptomyces sp. 135]